MLTRLADYFVVATIDEADLKRALEDSKRRTLNQTYHGIVVDRFPKADHKDAEYPRDLQLFCFPQGVSISMYIHKPLSFHFVLTEADGTRIYCCALIFYEELEEVYQDILHSPSRDSVMNAEEVGGRHKLYAPKCICMTSHWPFYSGIQTFLQQLYTRVSQKATMPPIERLLTNFMFETPLPPLGRITVEWKGFGSVVPFQRPAQNKKPLIDIDISLLFRCLSVENLLVLFSAVLCEKRMVFVSEDLSRLTLVAEAICSLIIPFHWQHVFIPILPQQLTDFVCAPMPFMVGVHSSYLPDELMLDRVVVVDLDGNSVSVSPSEPIPNLPEKGRKRLIKGFIEAGIGEQMMGNPLPVAFRINVEVVENTFLKFFAKMLRNYRDFLEAPSEFVEDKFDKNRFIQSQTRGHPSDVPFLSEFMETQMMQCFVDDRYADVKETSNLEVLFFDEKIDEFNKKETPFLSDTSQDHRSTHVVEDVNMEGLSTEQMTVKYTRFPSLSDELVLDARPVKNLLSQQDEIASVQNKTSVATLAMKFFQEKGQFNQHFHSLKLHSAKQDRAFRDVTKFLNTELKFEERTVSELDKLCGEVVDPIGMHGKTGTSIDEAWAALRRHKSQMSGLEGDCVRVVRDEVVRLVDTAAVNEHKLKILFEEASSLQDLTAKGKAEVERENKQAEKMKQKYDAEKAALSSKILDVEDIRKLVSTQSAAENALLLKDEADTNFLTYLETYEDRMPQIIGSIRSLNIERIEDFKSRMTKYVSSKKHVLQQMLASMDELEQAVSNVDVEKDREVFTKGTTDFWAIGVGHGGEKGATDSQAPLRRSISESSVQQVHRSASISASAGAEPALPDILESQNGDTPASLRRMSRLSILADGQKRNSLLSANGSPNATAISPSKRRDAISVDLQSPASGSIDGPLTPTYSPSNQVQRRRKQSLDMASMSAKDDSFLGVRSTDFSPLQFKKRALLSYPLSMWGGDGFEKIAENADTTKLAIKEVIALLYQWASILEKKASWLQSVYDKKPDTNYAIGNTQKELFKEFCNNILGMSQISGTVAHLFRQLHSHMRLAKGELKQSMKRYSEHRGELQNELLACQTEVAKAEEKVLRAQSSLMAIEQTHRSSVSRAETQLQVEKHSSKISRSKQEFQQAEHEHLSAKRRLRAIQTKHDVCIARILRLFENKIRRSNEAMHRCIVAITAVIQKYFLDYRREAEENMLRILERVSLVEDRSRYVKGRLPTSRRPNEDTLTFHEHMSQMDNCFILGIAYVQHGHRMTKNLAAMFDEYMATWDKEAKLLRDKQAKLAFTPHKCSSASLKQAFSRLSVSLEGLFNIWQEEVAQRKNVVGVHLHNSKKTIKDALKRLGDQHDALLKAHARVEAEYEKCVKEEKRCATQLATAKEKLDKALLVGSGEKTKKSFFDKFKSGQTPEALQKKLEAATAEHDRSLEERKAKEDKMLESKQHLREEVIALLQTMDQHESHRVDLLVEKLKRSVTVQCEQLDKLGLIIGEMVSVSREVDVERDIQRFISSNRTGIDSPAWVIKDMEKLDAEDETKRIHGAGESELELAGFDVFALTVNGVIVPELQATITQIDARIVMSKNGKAVATSSPFTDWNQSPISDDRSSFAYESSVSVSVSTYRDRGVTASTMYENDQDGNEGVAGPGAVNNSSSSRSSVSGPGDGSGDNAGNAGAAEGDPQSEGTSSARYSKPVSVKQEEEVITSNPTPLVQDPAVAADAGSNAAAVSKAGGDEEKVESSSEPVNDPHTRSRSPAAVEQERSTRQGSTMPVISTLPTMPSSLLTRHPSLSTVQASEDEEKKSAEAPQVLSPSTSMATSSSIDSNLQSSQIDESETPAAAHDVPSPVPLEEDSSSDDDDDDLEVEHIPVEMSYSSDSD